MLRSTPLRFRCAKDRDSYSHYPYICSLSLSENSHKPFFILLWQTKHIASCDFGWLRYSNSDKARSSGHRLLRLHDIISSVGGLGDDRGLFQPSTTLGKGLEQLCLHEWLHVQLSSSQVSWVSSKGLNRNGFKKMCSNESQVEHVSQVGYVLHVSPVNYVTLPVCV